MTSMLENVDGMEMILHQNTLKWKIKKNNEINKLKQNFSELTEARGAFQKHLWALNSKTSQNFDVS